MTDGPIKDEWVSDDGSVRLILGDCLEVLPTLEAGSVQAIVTDPPYGIQDAPQRRQVADGKRTGKRNTWFEDSDWDSSINPKWCVACSTTSPVVVWFGNWRKRQEVESAISIPIRCEIVWAKDCHVGPPCPAAMQDERIWLFSRSGFSPARFETTVWHEPIIPTWSHRNHRNEKPVNLMKRLVSWIPAETILDPFMGSGTTGVACVRTGRRFIGIEIEPKYFEISKRRIQAELDRYPLFEQESKKESQLILLDSADDCE